MKQRYHGSGDRRGAELSAKRPVVRDAVVREYFLNDGAVFVERGKGHENGVGRRAVFERILYFLSDERNLFTGIDGREQGYLFREGFRMGRFFC
jgi:hypothetical protein